MMTAAPGSTRGIATVESTPVASVARAAPLLDPATPMPEAWVALRHAPEGCGVVVRGPRAVAVVTRGQLAELWPAGGPRSVWATTVGDAVHPLGVEVLLPDDTVLHACRHLLSSGLPALPVLAPDGSLAGVVTARTLLGAYAGECPAQ